MTVYEADNLDISDAELKVNLEAAQGKTTWRKNLLWSHMLKPFIFPLHVSFRSKKKLNYLLRNTSLRQESYYNCFPSPYYAFVVDFALALLFLGGWFIFSEEALSSSFTSFLNLLQLNVNNGHLDSFDVVRFPYKNISQFIVTLFW